MLFSVVSYLIAICYDGNFILFFILCGIDCISCNSCGYFFVPAGEVVAVGFVYLGRVGSKSSLFEIGIDNVSAIVLTFKVSVLALCIRHRIFRCFAVYARDVEVEGLSCFAVLEFKGGILVQGICAVLRYLAERHPVCKRVCGRL